MNAAPAETERRQTQNVNVKAEIAPAQLLKTASLVECQEGSVVSRVLIRRDKGNVTLFAFDEGQELSEHTAPFDALVYYGRSPDSRCCSR